MVSENFNVPIYRGRITVYFGDNLDYIQKKYKTIDLSNYGAVTMVNPKSPFKNYVVAFCCLDNSLIAHEVVHLINFIYIDVGIDLDRNNDEPQAYLTGFLFDKIEKFLNKHKTDK